MHNTLNTAQVCTVRVKIWVKAVRDLVRKGKH